MSVAGREAFAQHIAHHIECGLAMGQSPIHIAMAIVNKIPIPVPNYSTAQKLLMARNWEPVCWLCGLRIFMDEMDNDYSRFSLDHVIPKSEGGTKLNGNIRLAHAICNTTRPHLSHLKPWTIEKMAAMKDRLRARMAREMQDQVA